MVGSECFHEFIPQTDADGPGMRLNCAVFSDLSVDWGRTQPCQRDPQSNHFHTFAVH